MDEITKALLEKINKLEAEKSSYYEDMKNIAHQMMAENVALKNYILNHGQATQEAVEQDEPFEDISMDGGEIGHQDPRHQEGA